MKTFSIATFITFFLCIQQGLLDGRSPFRLPDPLMPTIEIRWDQDTCKECYYLTNPHLEEYPIFGIFDHTYLTKHRLPHDEIIFRNHTDQSVQGDILSALIEEVLEEILAKKRTYTNFIILQKKDFNRRGTCGLIVLKFKDYPFVVKLFLETPKSFSKPTGKGIEQTFFFYMGGGVNRHLTGFTRLKNLERIKERLAQSPEWSLIVDTPRKWFWLPQKSTWLRITGHGFGTPEKREVTIPSVYAIVADAIEAEKTLSLMNKSDRKLALNLYNFLNSAIDPHIKNFMIESTTGKLMIVDTECFHVLVGFKDTHMFDSYIAWCWHLIDKCAKDMFWLTKRERHERQTAPRNRLLV